jgi:hypothetical protein
MKDSEVTIDCIHLVGPVEGVRRNAGIDLEEDPIGWGWTCVLHAYAG